MWSIHKMETVIKELNVGDRIHEYVVCSMHSPIFILNRCYGCETENWNMRVEWNRCQMMLLLMLVAGVFVMFTHVMVIIFVYCYWFFGLNVCLSWWFVNFVKWPKWIRAQCNHNIQNKDRHISRKLTFKWHIEWIEYIDFISESYLIPFDTEIVRFKYHYSDEENMMEKRKNSKTNHNRFFSGILLQNNISVSNNA